MIQKLRVNWRFGVVDGHTQLSFSCSENVKLECKNLLVGKKLMFVLDMWNKNYFSGESQMEASDLYLRSDQDSK